MIRQYLARHERTCRVPRIRGDDPEQDGGTVQVDISAPHTRRWSQPPILRRLYEPVCPAHTGIIRISLQHNISVKDRSDHILIRDKQPPGVPKRNMSLARAINIFAWVSPYAYGPGTRMCSPCPLGAAMYGGQLIPSGIHIQGGMSSASHCGLLLHTLISNT